MKLRAAIRKTSCLFMAMAMVLAFVPGSALAEPTRGASVRTQGTSVRPQGGAASSEKPAAPSRQDNGWASPEATGDYVEGELLVRFRTGVSTAAVSTAHASVGGTVSRDIAGVSGLQLVKLQPGMTVEEAVAAYSALPGVLVAQPNYTVRKLAVTLPDDALFGDLWGLHNTGQSIATPSGPEVGTLDADIDAPEAWDVERGSASVVVAVIDTGVDYEHPDLSGNMWVNPGEIAGNGVDDDGNGWTDDIYGADTINGDSDPMDDHGHGTHVAGTIGGAGNDGAGVVGVNWDVSIMAIKIFDASGNTTSDAIIDAFAYADAKGADVINCSWGGGGTYDALEEAAIADCSDALIVCAAGNYNTDIDVSPFYPACYDIDNIISVGASNRNDEMGVLGNGDPFSNYGATAVDVFAPGQDIWSTGLPSDVLAFTCDYTTLFEDQFDDMSNWTTDYQNAPWALFPDFSLSAPYSCGLVPYGNNESSWIDGVAPLDLSTASNPRMYWRMGCVIEYSYDFVEWGVYDESDEAFYYLGSFSGMTETPFDFFSADLSAFIGEDDVYLYFGLTSDGSVSSDSDYLGAFIDDLQVVDLDFVPSTVVDYPFTGDGDSWDAGEYDITPWAWDSSVGYSGAGSWKLSPYTDNESSWVDSPTFDLAGDGVLSFQYHLDTEEDYDYLQVWALSAERTTQTLLAEYSGSSGGWQYAEIDLARFSANSDVRIRFKFVSDGSSSGFAGAWVDDVRVVTSPRTPAISYENAYECWDGTSMAAPHVAGIAALLLARDSDLTPAELRSAIETSAEDKTAFDGKCVTGGRVNAYAALGDIDTGPTAADDSYSMNEDTVLSVPAPGVLANDTDEGPLAVINNTTPAHGTATVNANGSFTYTPAANWYGTDTFDYTVEDAFQNTDVATVTITVNDKPEAFYVPVYRFYRPSTGTHFYTADEAEMIRVRDTMQSIYSLDGVGYNMNVMNPANAVPLYRFYNVRTGTHLYTADESEKNSILANLSGTYQLDGIAYHVSMSGGLQVHRFYNPSKGVHFYSADPAEIAYVKANLGHIWSYEGPAYYVGQ